MSDFDAALERLVTDPSFAASLAADPLGALAGYHLQPDEIELLCAQVTGDGGGQRAVEERTSKASMFGLLAPLAGAIGLGATPGNHPGMAQSGMAESGTAQSGFGHAASSGPGGASDAIGRSIGAASHGLAGMGEQRSGGGTLGNTLDGADDLIGQRLTELSGGGAGFGQAGFDQAGFDQAGFDQAGSDQAGADQAGFGHADAELPPPTDYHTRVDVDGDGHWDKHTYVQRADGGVDILADMNHDGRADFVGHDYDRDGLVDAADYDKNRDGVLETHMFDDNRDGWMDRKIVSPEPPAGPPHQAGS